MIETIPILGLIVVVTVAGYVLFAAVEAIRLNRERNRQ